MRSKLVSSLALAGVILAPATLHAQGDPLAAGSVSPALPSAGNVSASEFRPTPMTLGVGFGWVIGGGADILKPAVGSVRLVLTDRFVLEPFVNLSFTDNEAQTMGNTTSESDVTRLGLGATGRLVLAGRGPIDLAALGRLSFSFQSNDAASDSQTTNVALGWGLGLSWFFYKNWALSLDATNPLFNLTRVHLEAGDQTNSSMLVGAIWSPTIALMLHLYF
jgi:hypothetical protein